MDNPFDQDIGYVVYPEAPAGSPATKAPSPNVHRGVIPVDRYFSTDEMETEFERLWPRVWNWVGIEHDLPEIGSYFRVEVGRESFVVVRSVEGRVQAFQNVCPHRANYLVNDDYGKIEDGGALYCRFHGWRFNLDGSVRTIKDQHTFPEENLCGMKGLREVRCEIWNSLIFVNLDPETIPLVEALDIVPEHLANRDFSRFRVYDELAGEIGANWKTAMEAFIEFYHSDDTHPQVIPISATLKTQYDLYGHGISRMIIPTGYSGDRAKQPELVTDPLKGFIAFFGGDNRKYENIGGADYRTAFADTLRQWAHRNGHDDLFARLSDGEVTDDWNYHLFPHVTINVFSHSLLIQSWTPHPTDPDKCLYRALSLLLPVTDPEQAVMDPASFAVSAQKGWRGETRPPRRVPRSLEEWGTVLSQDVERLPHVQRGLRSRGYAGNRLSASECRIPHYLAEVDRYLGK